MNNFACQTKSTYLHIYLWKTKVTSHKQHLFGLSFYRNAKKYHTDQSILQIFLVCMKRSDWQTFKCNSKNLFPRCACYLYNLLRWMEDTIFIKAYPHFDFFSTAIFLLPLKKNALKEFRVLHYLHNNSAMLIAKFKSSCRILYLLGFLNEF